MLARLLDAVLLFNWLTTLVAIQVGSGNLQTARSLLARCSLQEHVEAELSALVRTEVPRRQLQSAGVDIRCGASMESGPLGTAFLQLTSAELKSPAQRVAILVLGYPRSSTSTILSMVSRPSKSQSRAAQDEQLVFSLFEPCHEGDKLDARLQKAGCGGVMDQLLSCDFKGIQSLWGWTNPHSTHGNRKSFDANYAHSLCGSSNVLAYKSIDYGHKLRDVLPMLKRNPHLKVLDVVRDPRAIYASWKGTEPFATFVRRGKFYTLDSICESFASNIEFKHPHVHRVVFENLVREPRRVMKQAYDFLGLSHSEEHEQWIQDTFDAAACPKPADWEIGYEDCHVNSTAHIETWREALTDQELERFYANPACMAVVYHYGYASY